MFFTIKLILIIRIGIFIPIPGIDHTSFVNSMTPNSLANLLNVFTGGGADAVGIFALGIVPYINASIVIQLLTAVIPSLEKLQKEEGEMGRQKISQITRYLALLWSFVQAIGITWWFKPYVFVWSTHFVIQTTLLLVAGSMLIMWFAENITEKGIGNGTSIIIFVNIVSNISRFISDLSLEKLISKLNFQNLKAFFFYMLILLLTVVATIIVQEGTRKIPIRSARELGTQQKSKTYNNYNSYLPLQLNQTGVMPIIFASAILSLPAYLINISNNYQVVKVLNLFLPSSPIKVTYFLFYFVLIFFFSYFYTSITINPEELSNNLKKMTVTIPGLKPGTITEKFLKQTLNKLTFLGAMFLGFVAFIPVISQYLTGMIIFKGFGATSMLIVVGVAIDTSKQLQTYLILNKYENTMQ
uniref:Protein translocase subunit SecY n=1 Tax=Gronococcus sybilensis TaxID=3028029 RepID=A0A9Y1MXS4_9RHOD|nr:preprotein translocase subunit SecY [Gronococcus sybilensis]